MAFGIMDITGLVFRLMQNRAEIEKLVTTIGKALADAKPMLDKVAPDLLAQMSHSLAPTVPGKPALPPPVVPGVPTPNFTMTWLQESLNKLDNANLDVDGQYGPATKEAISKFQQKNGLVVDGWAGITTTSLIYEKLQGK
jgi:murein L,D-transpeptidase YcbB/YkuD